MSEKKSSATVNTKDGSNTTVEHFLKEVDEEEDSGKYLSSSTLNFERKRAFNHVIDILSSDVNRIRKV